MANELRNLFFGFLIFSLISVLLVTAVYEMGTNYGVSNARMAETTAGALNTTDIEDTLIGDVNVSENYRERFESGEVNDVDDASGIFSVLGDTISVITTPFVLLAGISENILGVPPIFTYTILTIINLFIIFSIWSIIRKGD